MPSLMTCSLNYQLSVTPELRRHLRPFNNKEFKGEDIEENYISIYDIYELKQLQLQQKQKQHQHQQPKPKQQQNSQKDCLQKIFKNQLQHKRRRWVLSCNLITILKQIKLTNPTFDIQQQQVQHCKNHQKQQPQLKLLQLQQHLFKI